jgi:hypothetical protein|tara:strand:+ start:420 stop:671 length:252 start_codon:yes stop_codon:yes gene_type:complete
MCVTRDEIAAYDEEIAFWEGCDEALVGVGERCGCPPVAVYDDEKLLECFMQQGMGYDEAREWIDFNLSGAWVGKRTPIILFKP